MDSRTRVKLIFLGALVAAALGAGLSLNPIPQDPDYHGFADGRTMLGIPNALNVLSNLPFVLVGLAGLARLYVRSPRPEFRSPWERGPYAVLLGAILAVGVGSAYYHRTPNDWTLFWDRLPMAVLFPSILGIAIIERISARGGARLFGPLVALGVGTLLYGQWRNDFRFYGILQGVAMGGLPLLLLLFPPRYTRSWDFWLVAALYAAAKAFEVLDAAVFDASGGWVSGHTLKHLVGALAAARIVSMLRLRRPLPAPFFLGAHPAPGLDSRR